MQFTRTKRIVSGLALAGAITMTGGVGFAQQQRAQEGQDGAKQKTEKQWGRGGHRGRHNGMKGGFGGRFMEKLNLTDAQKEQMRQIAARHHESTKALREQSRGMRGNGERVFDGTFNESAVRAAAQARANARVEMEVARARMMSEMYNVLTPEQKAQLAAERQQWEQKRQERRSRRQIESGGQIQ